MQANNVSAPARGGAARLRPRGTKHKRYFGAVCATGAGGRGRRERGSKATEDPSPAAVLAWFRLAHPELRLRLPGVSAANRPKSLKRRELGGGRPTRYSKAAGPCFEYQLVGTHGQRGSSVAALPPGGDPSSCGCHPQLAHCRWFPSGPSALADLLLLLGGRRSMP